MMRAQEQKVDETTLREPVEVSKEDADRILRHHVYGSFGVGLIPLPLLDLIAITGVQINMVRKLAKLYDFGFSKEKVKNIISSLVGGSVPVAAGPPLASLAKSIPIIGLSLGVVSMPIIASASTYAIGKVFIRHYESGGTFLTLKPEKVKQYYQDMFSKGKEKASSIKKDSVPPSSQANKEKTTKKE